MKVLVTGASGMLGSALCPLLCSNGYKVYRTDINTPDTGIEFLDIRNIDSLKSFIEKNKPDIIFHLAAETDVDKCEIEVEHAYLTNTVGTQNVSSLCKEYNILMAYISTCGVFDGKKKEPYSESDEPNPISIYTKTKFDGEKAVKSLLKKYFIFRAGWMIGGGKKDKKFVAKIVNLIKTRDTLMVVNDKRGCLTFTKDFSECIIKIIKLGQHGLYHVTNEGIATRYDIACKIAEYLRRKDVIIKPVSSAFFPLPAPRPDSEAVDNYKIKLLGIKMRPWEEALSEYLKELTGDI
jgi:dTDP-4-dehydrorhamnose reductase